MEEELRILILDDSPEDVELMLAEIVKLGLAVSAERVETQEDYVRAIDEFAPLVILAERRTPSLDGWDALAIAHRMSPETPFIFVTRSGGMERAVKAIREGATDYIPKEHLDRLGPSVQRTLREVELLDERKWAEVELFRSEERFRAIIKNASDLIVIVDIHGLIRYAGPSIRRILGYDPEEVTNSLLFDYFHPEEREDAIMVFLEILSSSGVTPALSFRVLNKNGKWRYLEGNANNLLDNQIVSGIVITARDVTDRVLQARNLQKLNQCFLSLGSQSYENTRTVVETSKEILKSTIVQYCKQNKDVLMAMSTKPGEEEFAPVADHPSLPCYQVIRDNADTPLIIEDLRRTGFAAIYPDIIRFGLKTFLAFPVRLEGRTIGCLSLFEKRRRVYTREEMATLATLAQTIAVEEERLLREERLREFIDIASHELRHPITLISGYAHYLQEEGDELQLDPAERNRILEVIYRGARRLDHLAEELLDISRIEQGELTRASRELDLEPLAREILQEIREKGYAHRFRLSITPDAARVEADEEGLRRLLVVLLDNACTFSPDFSQVRVEAKSIGDEVVVSVRDRGPGISDAHRGRIFDRFYQVAESTKHSKHGIGLGLYIAHEIVEQHKGRIWYEPRPGGGSVFRFTLPRAATGKTQGGSVGKASALG